MIFAGGVALLGLSACGERLPDWRAAYGRTAPNAVVATPGQPLVMPPTLDLPEPARAP